MSRLSICDSIDLMKAKVERTIEIEKREKVLESYGSTVCEDKEENGVKYTVYQMTRSIICANAELTVIPAFIGLNYGDWLVRLDLSFNNILTIAGIDDLKTLEELILNGNQLADEGYCFSTPMPNLTTLVLNNNHLTELTHFLNQSRINLPNICFLSLHGNPVCQDALVSRGETTEEDYERYRLTMIHNLPSLKFLDSVPVSSKESQEAHRRGSYLSRVAKPVSTGGTTTKKDSFKENQFKPLPETKHSSQGNKARNAIAAPTKYHYKGHHSEGNRFITDGHL